MKRQVYSVKDVKVSVFHAPMLLLNDAEARRVFSDVIADPQSPLAKHPADFTLYRLGEFDDNSGGLSICAQPEFICDAVEFVSKI